MRLAYADPPYPGQARRHYSHDPLCAEVDHAELITQLCENDGWALSTSSPALKMVLALCPPDVRVMAWVKPFASFKPSVFPCYAWEPVIVRPARRGSPSDYPGTVGRDWLSCNMTMRRGLAGAKPPKFCQWLFMVLGAEPGDDFTDLFPGTGVVGHEWQRFNRRIGHQLELEGTP
jgi:hypothetical protein